MERHAMTLVLIDFSNIAHMQWAVNWQSPDPSATTTAIVAKVRELASGQPHVALCVERGKSFRHELSADYKAHREKKPAALFYCMDAALDILRGDGFPIWGMPGYEADDVIASAVWKSAANLAGHPVLIVSADKDLAQLINERVTCFSPQTGKTRGLAEMDADFGIQPSQVVDFLALVGDAADNIKGANGIGAKGAAALLQTFGNLDDLYTAIDEGTAAVKPAALKALVEFRPRLAEVRTLLTLKTDAPIPFEEIFTERVPTDVATFGYPSPIRTDIDGDDIDYGMPTLEETPMEGSAEDINAKIIADIKARYPISDLPVGGSAQAPTAAVSSTVSGQTPPTRSGGESGHSTPIVVVSPDTPGPWNGPPPMRQLPTSFERQLEPSSISEAKDLANWMFQSKMFSAYGTPQAVLSTILAGRELGLQAMASLRAMHVVEGKQTFAADYIRSRVLQSGLVEYFRCTERTADHATFVIKRKGDPEMALTYTIEEAAKAGLVKPKGGWEKNPADMLVARASSKLARLVCPEVTFGIYAREEFDQ